MDNQNTVCQSAKRRRVNSSSAIQNQFATRKPVLFLDDTWLEALKHLTCAQWPQISLVCRQVNGVIQTNLSRLPRLVMMCAVLSPGHFRFYPGFDHVKFSMARSIQLLYHPASYAKTVKMSIVDQKFIDNITNGEARYIYCDSFDLMPGLDISGTYKEIAKSLKWLEQNVRCYSISLPQWMFNKVHKTVKIRAMLSNFIFVNSQNCKVQELALSLVFPNDLFCVKLVDILIEDFLALPVVQGTIPPVVIEHYPNQEQYRAHLGKNLIDREVDSQGADALYVMEYGEKRIRISFFHRYGFGECKISVKFYTDYKMM